MKKIILTLTTTLALMFPVTTLAYQDGNELLRNCLAAERFIAGGGASKNALNAGRCLGMVGGVYTMMTMVDDPKYKVCFKSHGGIVEWQAVHDVTSYLKRNPSKLDHNDVALIVDALQNAHPCK